MGLDSVELLIQFEKKFKKDVPDQVAEKIYTIGDMANWLYNNVSIHHPDQQLKDAIFNLVKAAFKRLDLQNDFNYQHKIKDIVPKSDLVDIWRKLEQELNLKIPELNPQDLTNKKLKEVKVLGIIIARPKPPILNMSFDRFIECIGALNYEKFVNFDSLTSFFEVKIAVMGITKEQCGLDIDEIFMDRSFTNDLGMD